MGVWARSQLSSWSCNYRSVLTLRSGRRERQRERRGREKQREKRREIDRERDGDTVIDT